MGVKGIRLTFTERDKEVMIITSTNSSFRLVMSTKGKIDHHKDIDSRETLPEEILPEILVWLETEEKNKISNGLVFVFTYFLL